MVMDLREVGRHHASDEDGNSGSSKRVEEELQGRLRQALSRYARMIDHITGGGPDVLGVHAELNLLRSYADHQSYNVERKETFWEVNRGSITVPVA